MPPNKTQKSQPSQPVSAPASATIAPSEAESAFKALTPRLRAIPRDSLVHVNVDLQLVSVFALGVSRILAEPGARARFAKLAKIGEYEDACVDELAQVAQAAWYARHRFLLASATRSDARISVPLLEEAAAQRARMLKLAEYWLADDAATAAEIAAIRAGTGYQDLANDLIALASLFERFDKELTQDRKLYRASDPSTANRLAGQILEQLGAAATQEQSEWAAMQPRVWTLLLETYEEVRRGGLFLFARDRANERFPSLLTIGRTPARPSRDNGADTNATPAPGPAPATTPPAEDTVPPTQGGAAPPE